MFLASAALGECQNLVQEAMPRYIANCSKWGLKKNPQFFEIMKNWTQGASVGVSGARLFQELVLAPSGDLDLGNFGATRRIFNVILDSVGFGRGPQIDYFFEKIGKKLEK